MASGFTRQIKVSRDGVLNNTNSTNTTSDNYSYYHQSKEQESYQHKQASWDPSRSFSNQYGDTIKSQSDNQDFQFGKNIDARFAPGVNIYGSQEFNMDAGIPDGMYKKKSNQNAYDVDDLLIKKQGGNFQTNDSFISRNAGMFMKVVFFVIVVMLGVIVAISKDSPQVEEPKYYYDSNEF